MSLFKNARIVQTLNAGVLGFGECRSALGSSRFSSTTNSRRVAVGAFVARLWHTSKMLEARTLVPVFTPESLSVRIGQVPLKVKPEHKIASRNVSQPVLAVPPSVSVSDCLKA